VKIEIKIRENTDGKFSCYYKQYELKIDYENHNYYNNYVNINYAGMQCGNMSLHGISYVPKEYRQEVLNKIISISKDQSVGALYHTMGSSNYNEDDTDYDYSYCIEEWESFGFKHISTYWNPYDNHYQLLFLLDLSQQ
jgi:hypothetical protein